MSSDPTDSIPCARVHFTFGARLEIIGKNEDKGRNNEKKSGGDESGVDEASRSGH